MGEELVIEWDETKRWTNIRKHGIDFADCGAVFSGRVQSAVDDRYDYGETRFQTRGLLHGRVVVVTHTERNSAVRVISVRKANTYEKEDYFKNTFPD